MAYTSWSVVFGEQPSAAKWNILGTNDASFNDGTGIADSAITPEKLLTGTGTAWGYTSYTPALTNATVGNGTLTSFYKQIGKYVHYYGRFTLGSTSAIGTGPRVALPVNASTNYATASQTYIIGDIYYEDSGISGYMGMPTLGSVSGLTSFSTASLSASGTYVQTLGVQNNVPFTWGTNDTISWSVNYEAA